MTSHENRNLATHQTLESVITHKDFNVARNGQRDEIIGQHRMLTLDSSEGLEEYFATADRVGFRVLQLVTSESVAGQENNEVVLEIPRDARNLYQILQTSGSTGLIRENGDINFELITQDSIRKFGDAIAIFAKFGEVVRRIEEETGKIPSPAALGIHHALYSRVDNEIILTPPLDLIDASTVNKTKVSHRVFNDVLNVRQMSAQSVMGAFDRGIGLI